MLGDGLILWHMLLSSVIAFRNMVALAIMLLAVYRGDFVSLF